MILLLCLAAAIGVLIGGIVGLLAYMPRPRAYGFIVTDD